MVVFVPLSKRIAGNNGYRKKNSVFANILETGAHFHRSLITLGREECRFHTPVMNKQLRVLNSRTHGKHNHGLLVQI